MPKLLIATNNAGKAGEFRELLDGCGWDLVTPRDVGLDIEVEEDGETYEENARKKALQYTQASGFVALADDSGLEVDALAGAPGVHSARYAGPNATDAERVQKLLGELDGLLGEDRSASFHCVIAITEPGGRVEVVKGKVDGQITRKPRGENGFGYDPVFLLTERGLTAAELPSDEKNAASHRGAAARKAKKVLERWLHEQA